jgi:DNA-directed RNA polymerase II subunit RPB2
MLNNKENMSLSEKSIFSLMDSRYEHKNILYEHLHLSYDESIRRLINYLETYDATFDENKVENKIYRNYFKFENVKVRPSLKENGTDLLFPSEARLLNLTYSIKLVGKITQFQEIYDLNDKKVISKIIIGKPVENESLMAIPNMVRSKTCSTVISKVKNNGECHLDPGGYFIVSSGGSAGGEKILLCLEKMVENKPLVFTVKEGSGKNLKETYRIQLNSRSNDLNVMMQGIQIRIKKDFSILLKVPIFHEVSIFTLLRAMGMESDKEMVDYITYGNNDNDMINLLKISINLSKKEGKKIILSKDDAINVMLTKIRVTEKYTTTSDKDTVYLEKKEYLKMLFEKTFMPHINNDRHDDVLKTKAYYICYMLNKLLNCYLGKIATDDRDSFVNKRIDMPGDIIMDIAIKTHKKMLNDCNKLFWKRTQGNNENPPNIINHIQAKKVELQIKKTLSVGSYDNKPGCAMPLPRQTLIQSLVFLRRIDATINDSSSMKLIGPRHYNPSQIGFLDATESPEHENIGLVKHLALTSSITINNPEQTILIYDIIKTNKHFIHINNHSLINLSRMTKIFLNGEWIGFTLKCIEIYKELKLLKQNNIIAKTNGITFNIQLNEIKIYTDSGRLYRPILNVKENNIILNDGIINDIVNSKTTLNKWDLLILKYPEAIDFIDVEEQFYCLIAEKYEQVEEMKLREKNVYPDNDNPIINRYDEALILNYTHCEIHPVFVMGMISGCTIYANHNMCTRNIFYYAQGKQAMGIFATNYRNRLDIAYILYHTQRPIVYSKISKYIHTDVLPCGENIMMMVACYTGMNQDDSLVFNQSSIDRGLFRSISLKKYGSKIEKNQTTAEDNQFGIPDTTKLVERDTVSYAKLNEKGYAPEETIIRNGDAIIGKFTHTQPREGSDKHLKDSSEIYKGNVSTIIDKVFTGIKNADGMDMINIRTRTEKIPKIGDKFCLVVDKTEVLTSRGWIKFFNLKMDDYVATLRKNKIVYEKPHSIFTLNYTGNIHKIQSDFAEMDVTMDHKMYVKQKNKEDFELIDSSRIYQNTYNLKKNGYYEKGNVEKIYIDTVSVPYNKFLEFFAIFINYGYIGDENIIHINVINNDVTNYLKSIISILNLNIKFNTNIFGGNYYTIYSKTLYLLFKQINSNPSEKSLPQYLLDLNNVQSEILLKSLCFKTPNYYETISIKMVNDITILAIHAGYSTSVSNKNNMSIISINELANNEPLICPEHESIYPFSGVVGCIEVSSHVFMIRQNNKCVWSGNCCYTDDHDVLTHHGWKNIKDVDLGDKIACLENDRELVYRNPKEVMNYDYDSKKHGPLYEIDTNAVSLKVTMNHNMYVLPLQSKKWRIETAEQIYGRRMKFKKDADIYNPIEKNELLKYENDIPTGFIFNYNGEQKVVDLNIWCIVFGIWLAEGWVAQSNKYEGYTTTFSTDKPRVKEILEPLLSELKITFNSRTLRYDAYENPKWSCHDRHMGNYLLSTGIKTSLQKYIPEWAFCITQQQAKLLIHGMMLGDGHIISTIKGETYKSNGIIFSEDGSKIIGYDDTVRKSETRRYDTSSERLRDDLQRLCLHAGYASSVLTRNQEGHSHVVKKEGRSFGKTISSDKLAYRITIIETQTRPLVNKNKMANGDNQQDKKVDFKGKVYCCRMYDDGKIGIMYMRRNYNVIWSCNSRSGQKGSIGLTLHSANMPFTANGITPDIIMNPHAYPSRLAFAQMLENAMGKIGALKGEEIDATPFTKTNLDDIKDELIKLGYNPDCTETFYNGFTGQKIVNPLVIGVNYYHRLRHLVDDKVHSRSTGNMTLMTRQPQEGRSKGGGGRLGEMERDSLIAHGNSLFLKERLLDMSDIYTTYVCDICGLFAQRIKKKENKPYPSETDSYECKACKNKNKISEIKIPYCAKLLFQELMSMNIAPRIRTTNSDV